MPLIGNVYSNSKTNDRELWGRSLAAVGLNLVEGSFEEGAIAQNRNDAVWHTSSGQCYSWRGAFPKIVPSNSSPESTGGISGSAWESTWDNRNPVYVLPFTGSVQQQQLQRNSEYVRPEEFGAKHDVGVDDTAAFTAALATGKKLVLGAFTYSVNLVLTSHFDIEGQGMDRTKLVAFDKTKPVVKNMFREQVWKYPSISRMTMEGAGTLEGVGFAFGDINAYQPGDELIGRVRMTDVFFTNFDKAIQKTSGNIGNVFTNVSFHTNNYAYWARGAYQAGADSSHLMHAGADIFYGGQVSDTKKMIILVMDTTGGVGQWLFDSTIFQFNPGGLAYFDVTGTSSTSFQAVAWHNVWNEANASAASVTIDSLTGPKVVTPSDKPVYTQMGFDHYELGKVWKHGTNSQLGQVNIWGEGRAALVLYGAGFEGSSSDTTRIGFASETSPNQAGAYVSSSRSGSNGVGRDLVLGTALGESIRMHEQGGVTIGVAANVPGTDTKATKIQANTTAGQRIASFGAPFSTEMRINACDGTDPNAAPAGIHVGLIQSTGRSINASGTVNASGADYAEYMQKAEGCGLINKGDICGVTASGMLTDKFDDAITFVVKSTDPSYVGGDVWGKDPEPEYFSAEYSAWDSLRIRTENSKPKESEVEEDNLDLQQRIEDWEEAVRAVYATEPADKISAAWLHWQMEHEKVRVKVDRIAFCGQVPCNVYGGQPGDYIVPKRNEDGSIGGVAITSPSFDQYLSAIGQVWKLFDDGRAWISVKIA